MKSYTILIAILGIISCSISTAHAKEPKWKKLSSAYGFILGQQSSLVLIEKKFPHLSNSVKESWFAFNSSALGESSRSIERELSIELGKNWPELKKKMAAQISTATQGQQLTQKQAEDFLSEVKLRAKGQGQLPNSILSTLLSSNKRYSKNPALEMAEGWKKVFSTKGHLKSKGINMKISYPSSWEIAEGSRPNIVQKFINRSAGGLDMVTLTTKTLPPPFDRKLTAAEKNEVLGKDIISEMFPGGSKILSHKITKIDGELCAMVEFLYVTERMGIKVAQKGQGFVIPRPGTLLSIQCATIGDASKGLAGIEARYDKTKGLYMLIGASCVFVDKWEENRK